MPKERYRLLSWHKARKCWRKKYRGHVYYLSKAGECNGPDDLAGYQKAVAKWEALKAKLDKEAADLERANRNEPPVEPAPGSKDQPVPQGPPTPTVDFADYAALKSRRRGRAGRGTVATVGDRTVAGLIDRYVEGRRLEATHGEIALDTYREAKFKLAEFAQFCEAEGVVALADVSEEVLEEYRLAQLALCDPDTAGTDLVSRITARKRLARLKQFLRHAWEQRWVESLPRNIDRFAKVSAKGEQLRVQRYGVWSVDQCRELFAAGYYRQRNTGRVFQRVRCLIAMALNTGATQKDLSTLTHEMVDWGKGTIRRQRHKTGRDSYFELWPCTLQLLRAEATDPGKGGHVLLTEQGNPLVSEKILADGTPSTTDSAKLAFNRTKRKAGFGDDPRGFATFRKVGATMLRKQFGDHVTDIYLAHTTAAMRKHYVAEDYQTYREALVWLGKEFHFEDLLEGAKA